MSTYRSSYLEVTCWCEAQVLRVPSALVLACQTASCGATDCRPGAPLTPSGSRKAGRPKGSKDRRPRLVRPRYRY